MRKNFNTGINFIAGPALGLSFLSMLVLLTWGVVGTNAQIQVNRTTASISTTR